MLRVYVQQLQEAPDCENPSRCSLPLILGQDRTGCGGGLLWGLSYCGSCLHFASCRLLSNDPGNLRPRSRYGPMINDFPDSLIYSPTSCGRRTIGQMRRPLLDLVKKVEIGFGPQALPNFHIFVLEWRKFYFMLLIFM